MSARRSRTGRRCARPRCASPRVCRDEPGPRRGARPGTWRRPVSCCAGCADDHFTFIGYREYELRRSRRGRGLAAVPGTGPGHFALRPAARRRGERTGSPSFERLPADARAKARERKLLVLTKASGRTAVPPVVPGLHRRQEVRRRGQCDRRAALPGAVLLRRVRRVWAPGAGHPAQGRGGAGGGRVRAQQPRRPGSAAILETYPRDELFQTPVDELRAIVTSVLYLQERRRLRLYLRQDEYGRYYSALVYLPRDRYTTGVRLRLTDIPDGGARRPASTSPPARRRFCGCTSWSASRRAPSCRI
ncbi:NAD-specific glutamate dehydrogenase [Streptomyces fumanus]